jgi:DNA invertase Pin-like site-specific DNA recombinase
VPNPHPKKVKGSKGTEVVREQRPIKRVIAYLRISKDRETQTSIETQEFEIRRLCEYSRWEVVAVLGDPGKSAYKKGVLRPQYVETIKMIERGQADGVVVFRLDRFSRSAEEFWDAWQAIKKAGGHFVSVSEKFDTSSKLGEAMLFLVATLAEMESEAKSDRARPMHAKQQRDGLVAGGPRPYGYDKVNSRDNDNKGAILTINEREADLLRIAAAHILAGGSIRGFINEFQPTSSQATKAMTHRGLTRCLTAPTIAGGRIHDGVFVRGCWEPILDFDTWTQVQEYLGNEDRKRPGFRPDIAYLLTAGIMVCSKCEHSVSIRNWVDKRTRATSKRYVCRNCGPSINVDIADPIVVERLFEIVPQSKWESWMTSGMGWDASILADIEDKLAAVDTAWSAGKMSTERWMNLTAELNDQKEAAMNNEPLDLPNVPNLREAWPTMSLEDQRRVLNQAIDSVTLLPLSFGRDPQMRIVVKGK